jgi:hypothetical protein
MLSCGMTSAHRELFRSLVIVALCFAFAALLWTAGGAVLERPAIDAAGTVTTERVKGGEL